MKHVKIYLLSVLLTLILLSGCGGNSPPDTPTSPTGPDSAVVDESLSFSAHTTDPDGDDIAYQFDWGDNTESEWSSSGPGQEDIIMGHQYSEEGKFEVRAIAKNKDDLKSEWSEPLTIEIYGKIGT